MSIVPMNYSTPEKGGTSEQGIYWGGYGTDISSKSDGLGRTDSVSDGLTNYQKVACDTTSGTNKTTGLSSSYYAYIPRQGSKGAKPTFYSSSPWAASPYMGDDLMSGGYNEYYGTTEFDTGGVNQNALADFKGIVNTKIITDLATGENWKTLDSLSNSYSSGYYPAACCCARYKIAGTKAFIDCSNEELKNGTGFWYLPACGELGYIIPRLFDINDTISKLNTAYGVGVQLSTSGYFWSSSEYSDNSARYVYTNNGSVDRLNKLYDRRVRAFLRLGTKAKFDPNGFDYVDMGGSVLWATCNVGASSPEKYGLYFAWGETKGYDKVLAENRTFDWPTYKWCNGDYQSFTKYNGNPNNGEADYKTTLDIGDDAAHANMGGDWRMPTVAEFQELLNSCYIVRNYNLNGVTGLFLTTKNDPSKKLFFPNAGIYMYDYREMFNHELHCWSSNMEEEASTFALRLGNNPEAKEEENPTGIVQTYKCFALSVRGVISK